MFFLKNTIFFRKKTFFWPGPCRNYVRRQEWKWLWARAWIWPRLLHILFEIPWNVTKSGHANWSDFGHGGAPNPNTRMAHTFWKKFAVRHQKSAREASIFETPSLPPPKPPSLLQWWSGRSFCKKNSKSHRLLAQWLCVNCSCLDTDYRHTWRLTLPRVSARGEPGSFLQANVLIPVEKIDFGTTKETGGSQIPVQKVDVHYWNWRFPFSSRKNRFFVDLVPCKTFPRKECTRFFSRLRRITGQK